MAKRQTMYNSDMVLYFLNTYLMDGKAPKEMIDRNIRTDYSKLRHFIRIDKMRNEGGSVITELVNVGEISGAEIKDSFPAEQLADPGNFTSLLYYFGLLTFDRVAYGKAIMKVPNLAVQEQIYSYLAETLREHSQLAFPFDRLDNKMHAMAYFGEWEAALRFFADEIDKKTVLRDAIYHESTTSVEQLLTHAETQLRRYASDEKVRQSTGNTRLRLLAAVYRGWQPVALKEFD